MKKGKHLRPMAAHDVNQKSYAQTPWNGLFQFSELVQKMSMPCCTKYKLVQA